MHIFHSLLSACSQGENYLHDCIHKFLNLAPMHLQQSFVVTYMGSRTLHAACLLKVVLIGGGSGLCILWYFCSFLEAWSLGENVLQELGTGIRHANMHLTVISEATWGAL